MMFSSSKLFWKFNSRTLLTALLLSIAPILFSCSSNPVDEDAGGPAALTVAPTHATPGVSLTVGGVTVDTSALSSYRLLIGGQQVFMVTDSLGKVYGVAPAFFADSTSSWPSPSATPLDIELFKDTALVGRGVGIFTSDSLIQVPGSTQKLVSNTIATVESYKSILAALPTEPGIQEQLTFAMTAALDSLMYGRGDSSLTALLTDLQANNPEALALLDATYGSDGSAERSQEIADAMAAIAASLNSGALRRGQALPADVRLAAQMQLSSLLKLFGDTFIHGASSTSSDIAFGASWASFSGAAAVPGAQVVILFASVTSTVLSMVDLIFNKILVASMPTVIDSFTITFNIDTIAVSDTTVSSLKVYARNSPPQITLGDLLSQFQGIMGLVAPGGGATLLQQLEGTLNYLLGQLNNALQAYATANPGFSYEPIFFDIAGVPIIHWEAEITDPRLLKLNKQTPRIAVIDSLLEWRSTGDPGSASVTISPSFSADATLLPIPEFLGYVGSSFGILSDSSALVSASKQVSIQSRLVMVVDFADVIARDGANVLGVQAGEIGIAGDTIWRSGLDVSLHVIGGGASPVSGTTDASGQFNSLVSLDPFSDTVEVLVTVTRSTSGFVTKTVMAIAPVENSGGISTLTYRKTRAVATAWAIDQGDTWQQIVDALEQSADFTPFTGSASASASGSGTSPNTTFISTANSNASTTATGEFFADGLQNFTKFVGGGTLSSEGSANGNDTLGANCWASTLSENIVSFRTSDSIPYIFDLSWSHLGVDTLIGASAHIQITLRGPLGVKLIDTAITVLDPVSGAIAVSGTLVPGNYDLQVVSSTVAFLFSQGAVSANISTNVSYELVLTP